MPLNTQKKTTKVYSTDEDLVKQKRSCVKQFTAVVTELWTPQRGKIL